MWTLKGRSDRRLQTIALHNEELRNLYFSQNTVIIIKSRRLRWAGHVVRMGEMRNAYKILIGRSEEKRPIQRRIILKRILGK
jgi:hypothetical protein